MKKLHIVFILLLSGINVSFAQEHWQDEHFSPIKEEVKKLLESNNINNVITYDGNIIIPLHWTLRHDFDLFKQLLNRGVDPDTRDTKEVTPLMMASDESVFSNKGQQMVDAAALLVYFQANVNAQDEAGFTPLLCLLHKCFNYLDESRRFDLLQQNALDAQLSNLFGLLLKSGANPLICINDSSGVINALTLTEEYNQQYENNRGPLSGLEKTLRTQADRLKAIADGFYKQRIPKDIGKQIITVFRKIQATEAASI